MILAGLFYSIVYTVNANTYTGEQLNTWVAG